MDNHQKALHHLSKVDRVMAGVIRRTKVKPLKAHRNHFKSLVVSVINQQLSGKAAATIEKRFCNIYKGKFPKPAEVLKTSDKKLRAAGLSFQKISYIKNIAQAVERGEVSFSARGGSAFGGKKITDLSDEEVINQLTQIKGIGRWTAEMFLMFSLGRPDVFSVGDLGLRNGLKKLYKIDAKRHHRKLKKLLDLWHPYKTVASRHLWASLD